MRGKTNDLLTEENFDIKINKKKPKKEKVKKKKDKKKKDYDNSVPKTGKRVLIIVLLIILGYVLYKSFNLFYYDIHNKMLYSLPSDYEDIYKGLYFQDGISIRIDDTKLDDDVVEYKNVKVKNYFKDFLLDQEHSKDGVWYRQQKSKNSFHIAISDTYIDKFIKEDSDRRLKGIDKKKIIDENNIKNDVDLFRFLRSRRNTKTDLFTPVSELKENFALDYFVSLLPCVKQMNLVSGDYMGYSYETNKGNNRYLQVVVLKDNKSYIFVFNGDKKYFTDDYVEEVLNTLRIS